MEKVQKAQSGCMAKGRWTGMDLLAVSGIQMVPRFLRKDLGENRDLERSDNLFHILMAPILQSAERLCLLLSSLQEGRTASS